MPDIKIFVSVGGTATDTQEAFVRAVEDRLRGEGFNPRTVGRNTFSADAPLKAVSALMHECAGAVVIGLERTWLERGIERRGGPKQLPLADARLPTPWNQIEAAMAYVSGLPLLVLVEEGVKPEGLLEPGYDWYVQTLALDPLALNGAEFNGVLASWRRKVEQRAEAPVSAAAPQAAPKLEDLTLGQILGSMSPAQAWLLGGAGVAVIGGAFSLGARLFP